MNPDQVPDDLARAGYDGLPWDTFSLLQDHDHNHDTAVRAILAAVLPAHERIVRAQVAHAYRTAAAIVRVAARAEGPIAPTDQLALAIWGHSCVAPDSAWVVDDPRTIAAVAYRWLADHLDAQTPPADHQQPQEPQ